MHAQAHTTSTSVTRAMKVIGGKTYARHSSQTDAISRPRRAKLGTAAVAEAEIGEEGFRVDDFGPGIRSTGRRASERRPALARDLALGARERASEPSPRRESYGARADIRMRPRVSPDRAPRTTLSWRRGSAGCRPCGLAWPGRAGRATSAPPFGPAWLSIYLSIYLSICLADRFAWPPARPSCPAGSRPTKGPRQSSARPAKASDMASLWVSGAFARGFEGLMGTEEGSGGLWGGVVVEWAEGELTAA